MKQLKKALPWLFGAGALALLWGASSAAPSGGSTEIEPKGDQPSRDCAPISARAFYLGLLICAAFESAVNWGLVAVFRLYDGRKEINYGLWQANAGAGTIGLVLQAYTQLGGQYNVAALGDPRSWATASDEQIAQIKAALESLGADPIMRKAQVQVFLPRYFLPACAMLQTFGGKMPASFAVLASACVQLGTSRTEALLQQAMQARTGTTEQTIMLDFCDLYIAQMRQTQGQGNYSLDLTNRPTVLRYLVETDPQLTNPHTIHGVAIQTAAL